MSEAEDVLALTVELEALDKVRSVGTEAVGSLGYRASAHLKDGSSVTGGGGTKYTALVNLKTALETVR